MTRLRDILSDVIFPTLLFVALVVGIQSCDRGTPPPKPAPAVDTVVLCVGGLGGDRTGNIANALRGNPRAIVIQPSGWDAYKVPLGPILTVHPTKHIALIGHSKGAYAVCRAATDLQAIGKTVDLLVILDGVSVGNFSLTIPGNVRTCIVYYAAYPTPFIWRASIYGTHEEIIVPRTSHNSLPAAPDVIDRITRTIAKL